MLSREGIYSFKGMYSAVTLSFSNDWSLHREGPRSARLKAHGPHSPRWETKIDIYQTIQPAPAVRVAQSVLPRHETDPQRAPHSTTGLYTKTRHGVLAIAAQSPGALEGLCSRWLLTKPPFNAACPCGDTTPRMHCGASGVAQW